MRVATSRRMEGNGSGLEFGIAFIINRDSANRAGKFNGKLLCGRPPSSAQFAHLSIISRFPGLTPFWMRPWGPVGKRRWRARTPRPVGALVAHGKREASWSAERQFRFGHETGALAGKARRCQKNGVRKMKLRLQQIPGRLLPREMKLARCLLARGEGGIMFQTPFF